MEKSLKIIPFLIAFILILPANSFAGQFKVTKVYDGDGIKAKGHDITIKVRLAGIDAPETPKKKGQAGQPFSQKAKRYLAGLVLNKVVDIKGYGLGRYNRILGVLHLNGKNINLEMVKQGLVEVYRGKHPRGFNPAPYRNAEREAQKAKRGAWIQGDKYISPKEWRKMQKRK
ncbi:MAG: thermonuclease family protein [Desulfatiglandales bacterium]|nr:thermonuclease family protein [Desulfatiglandales bacterium]